MPAACGALERRRCPARRRPRRPPGGSRPRHITLSEARSRLYQHRFWQPNNHFSAFFKVYSRPYRAKKSARTFLLPKKKNIWWRATIRGALAGRRSTLGQRSVNVGQRWVNVRSTLGQRSVISLPISGRFSRILLEFRVKQKDYMAC